MLPQVWQVSNGGQSTATAPMTAAKTKPLTPSPRETRPATGPATAPAPAPVARTSTPAPAPAPVSPAPAPAPAPRVEIRAPAPVAAATPAPVSPSAANGSENARTARSTKVQEADEGNDESSSSGEEEGFVEVDRRRSRGSSRRRPAPVKKSPLPWIILGLIVLVAILGIGLAIYFLVGSKDKGPQERQHRTLFVGPANPGGLEMALKKAKAGDRIVLQVDINEANLHVTVPNVTIEPETGRKVVWKCPPTVPANSKLLNIQAAGVTVKDITFDGDNKTTALIQLWSSCPGVKLENLKLQNSREVDLLFANCEGEKDNPVQINGVEFTTTSTTTAVRFLITEGHRTIRTNRFISFHDCRFTGPEARSTPDRKTTRSPRRSTPSSISRRSFCPGM